MVKYIGTVSIGWGSIVFSNKKDMIRAIEMAREKYNEGKVIITFQDERGGII